MKRQIKFRAWDKQENRFYAPTHEAYKGNLFELMIGFGGDLLAHYMKDNNDGVKHESVFPDRFILMQYTGCKDKNGNEIYEGDILVRSHDKNSMFKAIIEFKRGSFGGATVPYRNHFILMNKLPVCDYDNNGYDEIIGNIYEHPELLPLSGEGVKN